MIPVVLGKEAESRGGKVPFPSPHQITAGHSRSHRSDFRASSILLVLEFKTGFPTPLLRLASLCAGD